MYARIVYLRIPNPNFILFYLFIFFWLLLLWTIWSMDTPNCIGWEWLLKCSIRCLNVIVCLGTQCSHYWSTFNMTFGFRALVLLLRCGVKSVRLNSMTCHWAQYSFVYIWSWMGVLTCMIGLFKWNYSWCSTGSSLVNSFFFFWRKKMVLLIT